MVIDSSLVRSLLREQFPHWADLEVRPVEPGGWDNRIFRLGDELVARLPSAAVYAPQVEKEHRWLPLLAPHLPLAVPTPVAMGVPGPGYPWPWSVHRWIEGETPKADDPVAAGLAGFLQALQRIDPAGGPQPGDHNFHRGGDLRIYDSEAVRAVEIVESIDQRAVLDVWRRALLTSWDRSPVWIHGDMGPGNLLAREDRLVAVIDFGNLAVGDPSCDLAIAWTWFDAEARHAFRSRLQPDEGTWLRGRAWALWKALVVAAGISPTNALEHIDPMRVIQRCLTGA